MKRSYLQIMRKFEEALIAMSAFAQRPTREEWMGTQKGDRDICLNALEDLADAWTQSSDELLKLRKLTEKCVEYYASGEFDSGDLAVKDIVEFLYDIRNRARKPLAKKLPD